MKIAMFTDSYYPAVDGVVNSVSTISRELNSLSEKSASKEDGSVTSTQMNSRIMSETNRDRHI